MAVDKKLKVHIVGIEGAGTSALAQLYHNLGYEVSGSDDGDRFYESVLMNVGILANHFFDADNIPSDVDFIVHSTAFKEDNPEIDEAKRRGLPVLSYPQALGEIFNKYQGIAVCGTHGKTTTTAMLAHVMNEGGLGPNALVGSQVNNWKNNFLAGKNNGYFVLEADEYQNKLEYYKPWAAILTSLDFDHPDFFKDFDEYKKTFYAFLSKLPKHGFLAVWGDSSVTLEVSRDAVCSRLTYGFLEGNDYVATKLGIENGGQSFDISHKSRPLGPFRINLAGEHNILNASGVVIVAHRLGMSMEKVKKALGSFQGTIRRFQFIGEHRGALLIDDYAHHPEEIKASLKAVRDFYPERKVIAVFHPHTFSRTEALLEEFSQSFENADKVMILDIYGSAREKKGKVTSGDLVKLIGRYFPDKAEHVPTKEKAIRLLDENIGEGDLVITLGAGDVWKIAHALKK